MRQNIGLSPLDDNAQEIVPATKSARLRRHSQKITARE
jgi:hypothetical protein